ncbi:MAG: aminoglycoside phosphotransferase family protein, partial [Clostridia bacterium]|nr:aminoglycoside phosphotransferase family protein [Clostridia bacterium]
MEKKFNLLLRSYLSENAIAQSTVVRYGGGHINETYLVTTPDEKLILQKLNTYVFKTPVDVMTNLEKISAFLYERVSARGGDVNRELLNIVPTAEGKIYVENEDGFWRMVKFIDNTETYDVIENPSMFEECAIAFGGFQNDLADFPAATLAETIPNFHNTPDRYRQFEEAIAENKAGRLHAIPEEIEFVKAHRPVCNKLMDLLNAGELPLRVTHNDTKLSNILYDANTRRPICVIDLDTTMPGLVAYDFGDAIRGGACTSDEDEKDISIVGVNLDFFDDFAKGFL